MIVQKFTLKKIGWEVTVFYSVKGYYIYQIMDAIREIGCSKEVFDDAYRKVFNMELDTGLTVSNLKNRKSVMVIATTSNAGEFANSLQHEQRHLERHISEALNLDPYSEDAAYLAGDIAHAMHAHAKFLLCDECRKQL